MVNRRKVTKPQTQRVEVLNEGKVRRRRHHRPGRCHRDDEKERRKDITAQFEYLKEFLPKVKKNRTRQEILSCTRELIWELWRNEEILSLASVNQMECKITELEKLVVMKRDKKRQLEAIRQTATSSASTDYEVEVEEINVPQVKSCRVTSNFNKPGQSEPAEIVTDDLIVDGSGGYVLEEVLPTELYEQLLHDQQTTSGQQTPCGDFNLSAEEELSEAAKIVQDTFRVEEINNEMMSDEVEVTNEVAGDEIAEVLVCDDEDDDEFESVDPEEITQRIEEEEEEERNQGRVVSSEGDNTNESYNCENYRIDLNSRVEEARQSQDGVFTKYPVTLPPAFNNYFMPFQLWPAFIQPDQQVAGFPGFPVAIDPNSNCTYSNMPVPAHISPPPRSSLDMLLTQDMNGQVLMNDCVTSEVSGNVDVVN